MTLKCEDVTLYGGAMPGGYADCETENGRYFAAADPWPSSKDGDPSVRVDRTKGEVIFPDDGLQQRVLVALDAP